MKIRMGFVSNSSTSCFICKICGEVDGERDASAREFGIIECVNGHTYHEGCSGLPKEILESLEEIDEDCLKDYIEEHKDDISDEVREKIQAYLAEEDYETKDKMLPIDLGNGVAIGEWGETRISESACPMCQLEKPDSDEVMKFLLKSGLISKDFIKNEIKSRFANYAELKRFVNGKN